MTSQFMMNRQFLKKQNHTCLSHFKGKKNLFASKSLLFIKNPKLDYLNKVLLQLNLRAFCYQQMTFFPFKTLLTRFALIGQKFQFHCKNYSYESNYNNSDE